MPLLQDFVKLSVKVEQSLQWKANHHSPELTVISELTI